MKESLTEEALYCIVIESGSTYLQCFDKGELDMHEEMLRDMKDV